MKEPLRSDLTCVSLNKLTCLPQEGHTHPVCSRKLCYVNIQLNILDTWKYGKEIVKCPGQKGLLTLEPA